MKKLYSALSASLFALVIGKKRLFAKRITLFPKALSQYLIFSSIFLLTNPINSWGQFPIPNTSAQTQNFAGMGSSATAALPTGFKVTGDASPNYTGGTNTTATTQAAGTTGTGVIAGNSSGGTYNFADGITASAADRALGFLTSGSFSSPRSIMLEVENTTGFTITQLDIAFDYEKYRSGTRAFAWTFFSGTDGSTWTAQTNGDQAYAADANNTTVSNPPAATPKTVSITGLSIPNNGKYYLRWTFAGTGGSTNGQGIGIDNFSITATVAQPEIAVFENYPNEFDCADGSADIMVSDPTYFTGGSYFFSFNILNTGPANLNIASITETDPDNQFALTSIGDSPLAQNESTSVEFTFSPTSAGDKTAKFTINSNDSDESACVVNVTILGTAATCTDGIQNGDETGVDCGGSCPTVCPTCSDGIQNGDETGVDCGGSFCPACEKGTITIKKIVVYNAETDIDANTNFVFSGDLPDVNGAAAGDFTLQFNGQHNAGSLAPGSYVVTESAQAGWIQSVGCEGDNDNGSVIENSGDKVTIDLDSNEDIVCTFTNIRRTGTLTLVKALAQGSTVPGNDWQFNISHNSNTLFSPTVAAVGGSTSTFTLPTAAYNVAEVVPAGYDLTKINCGDAGSSVDNPPTNSFDILVQDGQNITCTFTNENIATGDLSVFKLHDINRDGVPNIAGGESWLGGWEIKVFAQGADPETATPLYSGFTATVTGNIIFEDIPQGTYLVCEEERSHWTITTGTICREVTVGAGTTETIFANFEERTYIFSKVSTPATNAAVYFDWTSSDFNGADPGDFSVTSDGVATVITGGPLLFTITELVPAGMQLVKAVCNGQEMMITDNSITFDARPAETDANCTFYNCTLPVISDQPDPVMACEGSTASFTVAATGAGTLSYHWEFLPSGGVTWQAVNPIVDGNPTLNLAGPLSLAANGNQYRVIITNDNGTPGDASDDCSVTSAEVTLTIETCPCDITNVSLSNQSACNDNGTADPSNDYFTADVTVTFSNPPATGFLELEQDGAVLDVVNVPVGSLVGNTHIFQNVRLKANGIVNAVEAQFSADQLNCVQTAQAPAVNSCSPVCDITSVTFNDQSACNNNGTADPSDDFYTADITVNFENPPATGLLELEQDGGVIDVVSVPVGSLVGNSHTFQDVRLKANGMANAVEAQFSADQLNCVQTAQAPAVNSCPCNLDVNGATINDGAGPITICEGENFTLAVDGATSTNLPNGGTIDWYYSTNPNFNPYNNEGTLLGKSNITASAGATTIYTQDFNSLINSGTTTWTDNSTLQNWYASSTNLATNGLVAGTGSIGTGNLYSFGTGTNSDRTLGSLASGGTGPLLYGVKITNNTGSTITQLDVSYTGEQWRSGGSTNATPSVAQTLNFQYQVNAPALNTGTWVDFNSLDFITPIFGTTTASSLDGNNNANKQILSATITGLNISPGETIWLRWQDINDANNDHGFGIDDLTVSVPGMAGTTITDLTTSFDNDFCNTTQYIKGIVNPLTTDCSQSTATTPTFQVDISCPMITLGTPTNPTTCGSTDGTIPLTFVGVPDGSYTLNYSLNNNATSKSITVSNNTATLSGLSAGTYANFSITVGNCTGTAAGPRILSDPNAPNITPGETTSPIICDGNDGTIPLTFVGVPNGTYTLNYSQNDIATSASITVTNGVSTLEGLTAGSYSNFSINVNGCIGTTAGPVIVNENPTCSAFCPDPNGETINGGAGPITVCAGENFTLAVNGEASSNLPIGGTIDWYYSTDQNFDPYNNEGIPLGKSDIMSANAFTTKDCSNLTAGDLAFVSISTASTPDQFCFVTLVPLAANTQIKFIDAGFDNSTSTFRTTEDGLIVWTSPNLTLAAGTVICISPSTNANDPVVTGAGTAVSTRWNGGAYVDFSGSGDQVFAFCGDNPTNTGAIPATMKLLAAINADANTWTFASGSGTQSSALPPGLTNGSNAVAIGSASGPSGTNGTGDVNTGVYNCAIVSGSAGTIATAINNVAYWTTSSDATSAPTPNCNYSVTGDGALIKVVTPLSVAINNNCNTTQYIKGVVAPPLEEICSPNDATTQTFQVQVTCPTAMLSGEEEICQGQSATLTIAIGTAPANQMVSGNITNGTVDVPFSGTTDANGVANIQVTNVAQAGTYTIESITIGNTCPTIQTSGTAMVTVTPAPVVVIANQNPVVCSTRPLTLASLQASITFNNQPSTGTWDVLEADSDGVFLNASNTSDPNFGTAVVFKPGATDIARGSATLILRSEATDTCPATEATVKLIILRTSCGDFPWNGQ